MELILNIAVESWNTLKEMAPYLLFGFFFAGIMSIFLPAGWVDRQLGGRGFVPILKASLLGVPLPLCSCSVIPVAVSLKRHGAGRGATSAFLLSTPQIGVDSIMVTFSLMGPVFAVFRPVSAFLTGLVGGSVVEALAGEDRDGGDGVSAECREECCARRSEPGKLRRAFHHGFVVLPRDIALPLFAGIAMAGIMAALVPDNFFAGVLGGGPLAMLAMMAVGMPMYVCATASVPIAAAMILKGASPGVAMVFLMTGPATNIAMITTLWKILGRRATVIYLAVLAVSAMGAGLAMDLFLQSVPAVSGHVGHGWMIPEFISTICAIVLIILLIAVCLSRRGKENHG